MAEAGTYVYGIARDIRPDAFRDTPGVAGADVRTIRHAGLTALASTVRLDEFGEEALRENVEDLDWLERVARAHHRVIDAANGVAPTAPMRLATIYRGDERVRQLLETRRDELDAALSRISGRVEWGVKAYADPDVFAGADTDETVPTVGSASPGTAYLLRRRAQRQTREDAWRHAAARGEAIDADLGAIAEDSRRHPPQNPKLSGRGGWMVLNGAYLVDSARAETFRTMFAELTERHPEIELELTGPWAPYSFAEETT